MTLVYLQSFISLALSCPELEISQRNHPDTSYTVLKSELRNYNEEREKAGEKYKDITIERAQTRV